MRAISDDSDGQKTMDSAAARVEGALKKKKGLRVQGFRAAFQEGNN